MDAQADISRYLKFFRGREDYLAQQGKDHYFPIRACLDPFYISRHFAGDTTFGLYVLTTKSSCHLVCIDIDIPKADLGKVDLADRTSKQKRLFPLLQSLLVTLEVDYSIPPTGILLEETGGRGYHVWLLLNEPLSGETAVAFGRALKSRLDFEIEFFPKQGSLGPNRQYGNLIKLPLGVHQKYGQRSVFFTLVDGTACHYESLEDSLRFLEHITPLDPDLLERAGEGSQAQIKLYDNGTHTDQPAEARRPQFTGPLTNLLTNCTALRQISTRMPCLPQRILRRHTRSWPTTTAAISSRKLETPNRIVTLS